MADERGREAVRARGVLNDLELRPRKSLGQNFLSDPNVIPRIVAAADIALTDSVIEVGPGLGVLTEKLADAAGQVVAVEIDDRLIVPLHTRLAAYPNAHLIHADALDLSPTAILAQAAASPPYMLVANIPYYITSALLRHFLTAEDRPTRVVVMVQREVAQRVAAQPPEMSLLAVSVQFYGTARVMFRVPAGAFYPPPKVDSAVLRIDTYTECQPFAPPGVVLDAGRFFALARAGFGQRRKQLANGLADLFARQRIGQSDPDSGWDEMPAHVQPVKATPDERERAHGVIAAAGLPATVRAEAMTMPEWGRLYAAVFPA